MALSCAVHASLPVNEPDAYSTAHRTRRTNKQGRTFVSAAAQIAFGGVLQSLNVRSAHLPGKIGWTWPPWAN